MKLAANGCIVLCTKSAKSSAVIYLKLFGWIPARMARAMIALLNTTALSSRA